MPANSISFFCDLTNRVALDENSILMSFSVRYSNIACGHVALST